VYFCQSLIFVWGEIMINLEFKYLSALFLLLLFSAMPASATTWHVPADFDSVSTAIEAALDGDTILIAPGTYPGPISFNKALTLTSGTMDPGIVILEVTDFFLDGSSLTRFEGLTISGVNSANSAFLTGTLQFNDCRFEGFHFTNAWGITFFYADVKFHRCTILNNNNDSSMFWLNNGTVAEFSSCEFLDNTSTGGVIHQFGSQDVFIQNCLFSNNHSMMGGAIYGTSGMLIESTRFDGNSASGPGGAIYADGNRPCSIINCSFVGNSAEYGGAMAFGQGHEVYLENTDFSANSASEAGGQGYFTSVSFVHMVCCLADLSLWEGVGQVTLNNDGCTVETQRTTLGELKAMFR